MGLQALKRENPDWTTVRWSHGHNAWVLMIGEAILKLSPQSCVSYWPNLRYNYDYSSSHKKVPPLITLQEKFWNLSFRDKVCFKDTDPFYLVSKESFLKIKHVKHFRSYCTILVQKSNLDLQNEIQKKERGAKKQSKLDWLVA